MRERGRDKGLGSVASGRGTSKKGGTLRGIKWTRKTVGGVGKFGCIESCVAVVQLSHNNKGD